MTELPSSSSPARVMTTLGHSRPDAPPLALSLAMQAGRTSGVPLPEILRDSVAFADVQLAMHDRWQHEIAIGMMYAAAEAEAHGSDVLFYDDGPPNVGVPIVASAADADRLPVVDVETAPPLAAALGVIGRMKAGLEGRALVAAVAVGPLSGPVMLCGMERWLQILLEEPALADRLVAHYAAFAERWARAQLAAGADALIWFEPLASTSLVPLSMIEHHAGPALAAACGLGAPVNLHLASANAAGTVDLAMQAGVALLSIGLDDDPVALRAATAGSLGLIGSLNGLAMPTWSPADAARAVRDDTERFGASGGFVLCDAHGEIPFQTDPVTLDVVARSRFDA